jgi:hypothetical protein
VRRRLKTGIGLKPDFTQLAKRDQEKNARVLQNPSVPVRFRFHLSLDAEFMWRKTVVMTRVTADG